MRNLAVVAVLAATVGACATDIGPTPAELKSTWQSQNVYPAGYKSDLLAFFRTYLNDPTHVRSASVSQPQLKLAGPNEPGERYMVCVRYTARDSTGHYTTPKEGAATFVSGKLDRFLDLPREVRELCKDAVFAPFPELGKLAR